MPIDLLLGSTRLLIHVVLERQAIRADLYRKPPRVLAVVAPGVDLVAREPALGDAASQLPDEEGLRAPASGREFGREFTQAYWARDGMVIVVASDANGVERAIPRLP